MRHYHRFARIITLLITSAVLTSGANASFFSRSKPIDPPSRVARLSFTKGDVSFSPVAAKQNVWVVARVNRPLVTGDRMWVDTHARAELQLGNAAVRIEDKTSLRIINLNDQIAQFDLSQGSLILHLRQVKAGQTYEIDTPQLAFRVTQPGNYRIDVSDKGDATIVTVSKGNGYAYAKNAAYKINSPHAYRFTGKNLQAQTVAVRGLDSFDKWSQDRETRVTKSRSVKYVSTTMIGYEDLDTYGNWRATPEYGYVWTPNRVPTSWAPYRYGHWSWIKPWGWTWVDDQPWGFAPSHYGRWAHYRNTWVWIPGPRAIQPTYAPALVVFIGGNHNSIVVNSDPAVAWFPLGPRDVYVPPYTVSKTYFNSVNASNTTINQVQITNVYNNRTTQTNYTNYQINNAITAVPTKSFTQSESTAKIAVPVTTAMVDKAPVTTNVTVTPVQASSTGTQVTTSKPADATLDRVPVVVTAPPASTTPVVQVTQPTESTIPAVPVKPAETVSHVEGTYNGGDSSASAAVIEADKTAADAKAKADKEAAEKAEADNKAAKEKADADQAQEIKTDADLKAAKEKAEADKAAAEKVEADKNAAKEQAEADKAAAEKSEADKSAAIEKAEAEKAAAEKAQADKEAAAANAEAERAAAEQATAAKAEKAQQAAEQAEAQRAAAEQATAAKAAAEQQAAEQAEAQRAAAEQATAAKAAAEQQAAEQAESQRAAAEQAAAAKADADRQAAEKAAAEQQAAAAKAEAEKAAAEQQAAPAPEATPAQ